MKTLRFITISELPLPLQSTAQQIAAAQLDAHQDTIKDATDLQDAYFVDAHALQEMRDFWADTFSLANPDNTGPGMDLQKYDQITDILQDKKQVYGHTISLCLLPQ